MRTDIVNELEALIVARGGEMGNWFDDAFRQTPAGIYSSVDLRHSGRKVVPVDTNLFPAGFNNLSEAACGRAAVSFRRFLQAHYPQATRLLLLPENHTRNLGYLENLRVLAELLGKSGVTLQIGRLEEGMESPLELEAPGGTLVQQPLERRGDRLVTRDGFDADLLVLNNDLTPGVPAVLEGVAQPVVPSPALGWHVRRKSTHFERYETVARSFAEKFGFDPWLITALSHHSDAVDFKARQGMEGLEEQAAELLERVAAKYREHGIDEKPYLYIKADAGTYGMGIMTVSSPEELREINKKTRNKMDVVKEGAHVSQVLLQEGVPTVDRLGDAPAEPMLYLVNGQPVGGAYRYNPERDGMNNLNAQGMAFAGMCDEAEFPTGEFVRVENCNFRVFGLIARLATLAAAREL